MTFRVPAAVLLPFIGTALGSGAVFFLRGEMDRRVQRALSGFAAGVMTAASVWSLILPAIERSAALGAFSFFPALSGVWAGVLFLLLLDRAAPRFKTGGSMLAFAVTLHNLPEGMAVGAVIAGWLYGEGSFAAVFAFSLGIALQNLPEGAIISMPLRSCGETRLRAFGKGVRSGIVEPMGAVVTVLLSGALVPVLPYVLCFAAGAMLYVVAEELIPEMKEGEPGVLGTVCFTLGFTLMMTMDVALG
ncbi:MAG: ZIP family metal transporter [Oscillospiraceae bacterium]|nr:ZIP family metal transporter [Oscillospiraceae bacterium]